MPRENQTELVAGGEAEELYQDPLRPFTTLESALSLLYWGVGVVHLGAWLGVFVALDKTLMSGRCFDRLGKFVGRRVTDLARVRVRQHGLERLKADGSYVFCINHVSLLDMFVVFQSIPFFHRSFQDAAHFKIPIYGGVIRVFGQLPVSRKDKELNRRSFAHACQMLQGGDSFVVFPEGHRSRDGRLGKFHLGGFRLAIEAGVPVVPMGLRGLRNICPAGDWRMRPGTVDVLFGDPIRTDGLGEADARELADRTRRALDDLLREGAPRHGTPHLD
jgi:1-acyl-sn-glycerol-3-phosphate acyltransferase